MIRKLFNKTSFLFMLLALCCSSAAFAETSHSLPPLVPLPSLSPMLEKTMQATVNIAVQGVLPQEILLDEKKNSRRHKSGKFESLGSGVILDTEKGYIITNAHVVQYAKTITVTLNDGSRVSAKLIGLDDDSDLAVLQIKTKNLPYLPIGDSSKLRVGDFVAAVGNPFGLNSFGNSQTVTLGIISALQRSELNIEGIENFIQTDAAINPGNSGGALLNMHGELIGISTAILAPYAGNIGIGFAIPVNMVMDVMKQIVKYGSIHRGLVGVYVQPLIPDLSVAFGLPPRTQGALIAQVNADSPAEKAGLKAGDAIISINHEKVTDASQVKNIIGLLRVGSNVQFEVIRDGKTLSLQANVADAKKREQQLQSKNPFLYGLALKDFTQESPSHGRIIGVQVIGVSEASAGWRAGLRPGDVIVSANHKDVENLDDLQAASEQAKTSLLIKILRGPASLFLIIK